MKGLSFAINLILLICNILFFIACFASDELGKESIFLSIIIFIYLGINISAICEED